MLSQIRKAAPLIHCITNYVVANYTANGLLAIGASPVMADDVHEVDEMVSIAQALLINIGTLNERTVKAMLIAGKQANTMHIPVVLDPVGVGATSYRKQVVEQLLAEVKFDLIRCNAGELATIGAVEWRSKGVDSGEGNMDISAIAKQVALKYSCLVAVTGKEDIVTDGHELIEISGGQEITTRVTGTGCLLSAICAATLASGNSPLQDLSTTLQDYKRAAEPIAAEVGTFSVQLLNAIQAIAEEKEWLH